MSKRCSTYRRRTTLWCDSARPAGLFFRGRHAGRGAGERTRSRRLARGGLIEDGLPIPTTQTMAQHQSNPDFAGGVWAVVEAARTAMHA